MGTLDSKQSLEAQWKKLYKPRVPKRGTSELLRKIDGALKIQDYDRMALHRRFAAGNTNDPKRLLAGFAEAAGSVKKQYEKFKDWTPKENDFLKRLVLDLQNEAKAWQTFKPTPPPKAPQDAPAGKPPTPTPPPKPRQPAQRPPGLDFTNEDERTVRGIVRTADQIRITITPPTVIPAVAQAIPLMGHGTDRIAGMPVCVEGDELPKVLREQLPYTAAPYLIPGVGMLTLRLAPNNLLEATSGGKRILSRGDVSRFEATFTVITPAMTPPAPGSAPMPDPVLKKTGTAQFV